MDSKPTPVVVFVGGVGSGKSAVAGWLADHDTVALIDADRVGHQVLLCEDVKAKLLREFGDAILKDGEIDRSRLAAVVFGETPEHHAARSRLESIVHPEIGRMINDQITTARQDDSVQLIVCDAAVLLEAGWRDACDVVVFVDVPREERKRRVINARGWSEDELDRREASQWPLDRKRAASDVVIDNSQTVEYAGRQLVDYLIGQGRLNPQQMERTPSPQQDDTPALSNCE